VTTLVPRIPSDGRRLEFDFPGIEIGVAEYDEGPTGCTVFHFPRPVSAAVDVRGGSPGLFQPDLPMLHGLCFAGGSLMGLEACTGVAAELFARRGQEQVAWTDVPLVAGAIIFDFAERQNGVYPDKELGGAALRSARPGVFPLGRRGAGRMASVGKGLVPATEGEASGQGGAFGESGPVKIAVFTVVNALGAIAGRDGQVVRGNLDRKSGLRLEPGSALAQRASAGQAASAGENTTLTLVATNMRLGSRDLQQLARQVHASMGRAIQPFHTNLDGDALFAVTTNEVEPSLAPVEGAPPLEAARIGILASELAWDAVLSCWDDANESGER
jgi:L-aminopeptidase/D-esterase-like protein